MADSNKRAFALATEIARLRELQLEDLNNAAFLGWTPELKVAHDKRELKIAEFRRQLEGLNEPSS